MKTKLWLNGLVVLSMLLAMVPMAVGASPASDSAAPEVPDWVVPEHPEGVRAVPEGLEAQEEFPADLAVTKIDPLLQEAAAAGGKDLIDLYVSVQAGTDLSQYLTQMIVRPAVFGGVQAIYGKASAGDLLKIAQMDSVVALVATGDQMLDKPIDPEGKDRDPDAAAAQLAALIANDLSFAEAEAMAPDVGAEGWFDVLDGHKSSDAWAKGFTGQGVVVGVMDDGIDFAHPDLQGTTARVMDPASPYYGWPMAFSQVSMQYFAEEVAYQDLGARGITSGWNGSRWSDTQTTEVADGGEVTYQPLSASEPHVYTVPGTSLSGSYKLGSHPDRDLLSVFGERVAVLVADEAVVGVYDTVYVDLDNDYDFTDEKPVTKASPEVYRDLDGDGYADISGGMLVWISDGANVPPTADWLWGVSCGTEVGTLKACPDSGELVLFTGPFEAGDSHGTLCASNVAAQGVVNEGLSAQPFRVGGMVQGAAPEAGLMDYGNIYYTGTDEDNFIVAAMGYDGIPMSGDETQITSNSYGAFTQMWGGWGYIGRLITALNMSVAPSTVWLFSSGNEGPGYGPQEGDGGPTTIQVGSSTQYGSTNWDSAVEIGQINYGDPNSFFSKGPNRDGSTGLDVLANGGRGSGDQDLNYAAGFYGASAWETWGGTSRSAPHAAGNLALVFQAYKDRFGEWPTWDQAKAFFKSGATNSVSSPFYQGAGVVNADRATDLAAGIYGVYAEPTEWQVGDWEGEQYLNFAKVAYAGESYEQEYEVTNPSGYEITVDLSQGVMERFGETLVYSLTTANISEESAFNFHTPDYLLEFDDALIPADAEVMIVRYYHDYDSFDSDMAFDGNPNSSWRFMLYNWTDQNGDDRLWEDLNANGTVNHEDLAGALDNDGFLRPDYANSEIQEGEYVRMDYDFLGLAVPMIVHDPLERMADGYFFGFQHRNVSADVPTTTLNIAVEFYKREQWDWLDLSTDQLTVPAESSETFLATLDVPEDAIPGAYEGVIFVNDPGDEFHAAHETALPVMVNVIGEFNDGAVILGGEEQMADTMYQNSYTYGYFTWYGGGWTGAGDWRHYFLDLDEETADEGKLLIHTSWEQVPTDLNTWLLGPTEDCASNGVAPCAWYQPGLGQPDPDVFGPYTLDPIAGSGIFRPGTAYPFDTTTGGPDDWLAADMVGPGLYEIALHNVVYAGTDLTEGFQVDVGTISLNPEMDPADGMVEMGSIDAVAYGDHGEIELWFEPSLEIPDLEVELAGGLEEETSGQVPITVLQSEPINTFSPWLDYVVTDTFTLDDVGTNYLEVYLDCPTGSDDPDLFLIYDSNHDGSFTPADGIFARDGGASGGGCSELVTVDDPPLGDYAIFVDGYTIGDQQPGVSAMEAYWQYWWVHPGDLPVGPHDVFEDGVLIGQDDPWDPSTAGYTMTVTGNALTYQLYAELTDIPAGSDVDLFLVDITGTIVASSQNLNNADEYVTAALADGQEYTIWVHGFYVPDEPIEPTLRVYWDQDSIWLTATDPDVSIESIGAGEQVSVTLHYDRQGWWEPGDAPLSARVIAGPSVLPGAFDELLTIEREDAPGPAEWNPGYLEVFVDADSERGFSPFRKWSVGGVSIPTALVAAGERVTYTVEVTNWDMLPSEYLWVDAWPLPYDYLATYFGVTGQTDGVDYGLIESSHPVQDYGEGIWWEGVLDPDETLTYSYWVEMPADMALLGNHTTGVDVYLDESWDGWFNWALAGAYYRSFRMGGSSKVSMPTVVEPGAAFTYEFSLYNPSAVDQMVYMTDELPEEVTFLGASPGVMYSGLPTHTVYWEGLLPGSSLSTVDFDVQVQAASDLMDGYVIENEAVFTLKAGGDPYTALYATTTIDDGVMPMLAIYKMVDNLIGMPGHMVKYSITVTNYGTEMAEDVVVTDHVPSFLDVKPETVTATLPSTGELYSDTLRLITWEGDLGIDVMSPQAVPLVISFEAEINDTATYDLAVINAAEVGAANYPGLEYNSALTEILLEVQSQIFLPLIVR